MRKCCLIALLLMVATGVHAEWYWPFKGSGSAASTEKTRLSELMEPASLLIDDASDLAADGKVAEAIEKYRKALEELDRIESEYPERANTPEFASLRNKRAYVNAAIDSMLLSQVKANAKVVAVSDTTELEKRLAEEKKAKAKEEAKVRGEGEEKGDKVEKVEKETRRAAEPQSGVEEKEEGIRNKEKVEAKAKPLSRRQQAMADIAKGDYAAADIVISEMLMEKPNGEVALNLKAMSEVRQGKFKEAERTLDQAIMSNPRSYYAYYNMADLILRVNPNGKPAAKRYYETGRAMGGPVDNQLETALK